jgi:hypothetical protein
MPLQTPDPDMSTFSRTTSQFTYHSVFTDYLGDLVPRNGTDSRLLPIRTQECGGRNDGRARQVGERRLRGGAADDRRND